MSGITALLANDRWQSGIGSAQLPNQESFYFYFQEGLLLLPINEPSNYFTGCIPASAVATQMSDPQFLITLYLQTPIITTRILSVNISWHH
jgi:hypothetical protein